MAGIQQAVRQRQYLPSTAQPEILHSNWKITGLNAIQATAARLNNLSRPQLKVENEEIIFDYFDHFSGTCL